MLDPILIFGAFRIPVYSLLLAAALMMTIAAGAFRSRYRPAQVIDVALGAILFGLIGARIEYVLLSWDHFGAHSDEIARFDLGGLGWHGAVIGGWIGLTLVSRWRGLDQREMLRCFAWALPVIALAAWVGCAAAGCAYGREVDTLANYPDWLVWEARDVYGILAPRYSTARFGVILAFVTAAVGVITRGDRRFPAMLMILSAGMFAIGFVRADVSPLIAGLRADQVLDAIFVVWAVQRIFTTENTEATEKSI